MKLSKISLAVAAVAAFSSGSAVFAGQIGSSSVTVASEVIFSDAQIARAPSNAYSFSGDIDARSNAQLLQLQYTLSAGTWNAAPGQPITAVNTLASIPLDSALKVNYTNAVNVGVSLFPALSTINAFITADKKTLVFNVTIPALAAHLLRNPQFTINPGALGALAAATDGNIGISGLKTVVGDIACFAADKNIDISFKHFTTHNGNTDLVSATSPDSEHVRSGSTNSARMMNFVQNQILAFTPAANSRQDAATLNFKLAGTNFTAGAVAAAVAPAAANIQEPAGAAPAAPKSRHYLGRANLTQRANGTDLNYSTPYGRTTAGGALLAADFDAADDIGTLATGVIEMKDLVMTVTFPTALPTGTVVMVRDGNGAAVGAIADVTTAAGQTVVTFTATTAAEAAQFGSVNTAGGGGRVGGAHLWMDFPGNAAIPQLSSVTVTASLNKDTAAQVLPLPELREQNLTCTGAVAGVGGGIKIDIRNYASFAAFGATGPQSIVRLINNSEVNTADVYAQMIYADGKYGPYGLVGSLAPREVLNINNKDLEAKMTTAAPTANPFGTGAVYTSVAGNAVVAGPKAGVGDRVRFVSNTGTTLRVQSFMILGSTILDTSQAQGVDFENTTNNRAPTTDAQPNSQDAINGLAR